jgi:hypothetical protein
MDTSLIFDILTMVLVLAGAIFAGLEIRHMNRAREHANMLALISSFTSPEFNQALLYVFEMPEGLSKKEVEKHLGSDIKGIYTVMTTLESYGILLHRGEVTIDILDDFFSGPIVLTWQKLSRYIEGLRLESNRETIGEWVQWLAEQMMLRETDGPTVGAHVMYKDWRPPK